MAYETIPKRLQEFAEKWVPGLKTYLGREKLRDLDKVLREGLADRLDQVKETLNGAKLERLDNGSIKNLDKIDRAVSKVDKVRETIRYDQRGMRGLFDAEEVAENELMGLLDFDQKLHEDIDELMTEAQKVASMSDADLMPALRSFESRIDGLTDKLKQREQYNLGKEGAAV